MRYVLYHAGCPDGTGAAYAAWKRFSYSEVMFEAVGYHDDLRLRTAAVGNGDDVYVLDFGLPRELYDELLQRGAKIYICDHHVSQMEIVKELFDGYLAGGKFDLEKSGAVLAWEFFNSSPVPQILLHVQDRDLWQFKLPGTRPIVAALWSYPAEFDVWDCFARRDDMRQLWEEGDAILRSQERSVQRQLKFAYRRKVAGYEGIPCVNTNEHFSDVAHALLEAYPDAPFAAYYHDINDTTRRWGLRSRQGSDVDVAAIAQRMGGGGHENASGFNEVR